MTETTLVSILSTTAQLVGISVLKKKPQLNFDIPITIFVNTDEKRS